MSYRKLYSIYCITEASLQETWSLTPITQCPNNPEHIVNPNSVNEEPINLIENVIGSGANTDFTINLVANHSENREIILPDTNDTLVGTTSVQTITNKDLTDISNDMIIYKIRTNSEEVIIDRTPPDGSNNILITTTNKDAKWENIDNLNLGSTYDSNSLYLSRVNEQEITDSMKAIEFDTINQANDIYNPNLSNGLITFNETGLYEVNVDINVYLTSNNARTSAEARMVLNNTTEIPNTRSLFNVREFGSTGTINIVYNFNSGDTLQVQVFKVFGKSQLNTLSDGIRLLIKKL